MDAALNRIKRKLEAAELVHLRHHAAELQTRIEMLEERARHAEEMADWYWQEWRGMIDQLMEEGEQVSLHKDGHVSVKPTRVTAHAATIDLTDKQKTIISHVFMAAERSGKPVIALVTPEGALRMTSEDA